MKSDKVAVKVTGWLLLILGSAMALIFGKGDINVIIAGIIFAFGGIYVLSLVDPATKQFLGKGWTPRLCRIIAGIAGLLMISSGLIGLMSGIREIMILHNAAGLSFILIDILLILSGLYVSNLVIQDVQYYISD